ncbi:hypothetical protein MFRU_011g02310 [Monilinia fructicola]|uniref:Uncharacterized protein n=1 Tax=Monilinia fructicola TaxID=38448 RepID=A0A5M9JQL0_MONFR|nr:hypothetical protein EYC84_000099 [Monilinia fructicola]KAG4030778.1 hypothetical protein MFRU_011g02310 [Monilinia fructicola]
MAPNASGGRPYTRDELIFLRDSPLVVKPTGLLSTAEWMGQTPDANRNNSTRISDRTRDRDANPLLEHTNRRPKNNANTETIQLVPTRTTFSSANPARNAAKGIDSSDRQSLRESESQTKLSFRTKIDDSDDRPRRDTLRPKPGDGADADGWKEVKPRKSFGTEGAERFTGRMGGERHRDEKRFKDREERDTKERPRGFDNFSRDKDKNHEQDNNRRTTNGRGRAEPSWFRENNDGPSTPRERNTNAERFESRHKSWREKDADNRGDRGDKGDRRWGEKDRDHEDHNRSIPEWAADDRTGQTSSQDDFQKLQTSTGNNSRKHTAEDMQKWKEAMHSKNKTAISNTVVEETTQPKADEHPLSGIQKSTALAPLDTGTNGDEFFRLWATPKNDTGIASKFEANTENMTKSAVAAPGGKTSRFNKFFNQDEPSRKAEPHTAVPKPTSHRLEGLNNNGQSPADREAMPMILAMLQSSGTPPVNPMLQSEPAPQERQPGTPFEGRDPPLPRLSDRHDEMRSNAQPYPHNLHDLNAQRESTGIQPTVRPEEMLHHLVNQRQHAISQSSFRTEQPRSEQTAFLMSLMREAQAAPEPQRTEQIILGHPPRQQPSRQLQHQQQLEREQELQAQRERVNSQRRPPGFFDESVYRGGPPPQHDNPRPQPTHILPRPPPGLEQLQQGWPVQPSSQHPPPQQFRPTAPPGLAGNVPRPMQMPQQVLPPGFQMNNFPPPEALAGPRNIPFNPAYFNGPPPGFLPPVMSPFAAEGMPAFPFDARGPPPPQGAFRRQ